MEAPKRKEVGDKVHETTLLLQNLRNRDRDKEGPLPSTRPWQLPNSPDTVHRLSKQSRGKRLYNSGDEGTRTWREENLVTNREKKRKKKGKIASVSAAV